MPYFAKASSKVCVTMREFPQATVTESLRPKRGDVLLLREENLMPSPLPSYPNDSPEWENRLVVDQHCMELW